MAVDVVVASLEGVGGADDAATALVGCATAAAALRLLSHCLEKSLSSNISCFLLFLLDVGFVVDVDFDGVGANAALTGCSVTAVPLVRALVETAGDGVLAEADIVVAVVGPGEVNTSLDFLEGGVPAGSTTVVLVIAGAEGDAAASFCRFLFSAHSLASARDSSMLSRFFFLEVDDAALATTSSSSWLLVSPW